MVDDPITQEPQIVNVPDTAPTEPVYKTEVIPEVIHEEVPAQSTPRPESSKEVVSGEEATPENISLEDLTTEDAGSGFIPDQHHSNKKTIFFVIMGALLFFFLFFFIILKVLGIFGGSGGSKITLEYWGLWEDQEVLTPLIDQYQREHKNIEIKYSKRDPDAYREKLIARSKEGRGPDIFRYHSTWVPSIRDVLSPIPSKVMSNQEFEKTFYPVAVRDLKIDSYYYGIPLYIDGLVLVYNEELFKKAGIELAPKTWDDILDYASRLTVKDSSGKIVTAGVAIGTAHNIAHFSDIFGWMLLQNGADLKNLRSQEATDTLAQYRRFAEPPDNTWDTSLPNSVNAFSQGRVAMIFVPSWQIASIKQINPDISLRVSSLPKVPGGVEVALSNYWVEGVSKFSKHQHEAWQFLKFLSEKEVMTKIYLAAQKSRGFGSPYSRVDLRDTLIQNELVGPVLEQAPKMRTIPLISNTYDNGLNDEIIKYLENAINATEQGVSYEEALSTADKGVQQVFKKFTTSP